RNCHNDRDRGRRLFRRSGWWCAFGDDNVDLESNQVGGKDREPVIVPVCISVLDGDVPALDIAEGAQSLPDDLDVGRDKGFGAAYEEPYPVAFCQLLRLGAKGRGEKGQSERGKPGEPHRVPLSAPETLRHATESPHPPAPAPRAGS